jgi:hypothetical protein
MRRGGFESWSASADRRVDGRRTASHDQVGSSSPAAATEAFATDRVICKKNLFGGEGVLDDGEILPYT